MSRQRDQNRHRLALAWSHTRPNGIIIVSGHKTDGVDAFIKEVKKSLSIDGVMSKAHGKVFWLQRGPGMPPKDWFSLGDLVRNEAGYFTAPGMFSSAHIDPGSELLAQNLNRDMKGRLADLGAGWGYLSVQAEMHNSGLDELHLFEADHEALEAAKRNLRSPKAHFHWTDVTRPQDIDGQFDWVISNPPFHEGRKSEPSLGQAFIATAAKILKKHGTFLMVANRQLPYERSLDAHFRHWEKQQETNHYKIFLCKAPK